MRIYNSHHQSRAALVDTRNSTLVLLRTFFIYHALRNGQYFFAVIGMGSIGIYARPMTPIIIMPRLSR